MKGHHYQSKIDAYYSINGESYWFSCFCLKKWKLQFLPFNWGYIVAFWLIKKNTHQCSTQGRSQRGVGAGVDCPFGQTKSGRNFSKTENYTRANQQKSGKRDIWAACPCGRVRLATPLVAWFHPLFIPCYAHLNFNIFLLWSLTFGGKNFIKSNNVKSKNTYMMYMNNNHTWCN